MLVNLWSHEVNGLSIEQILRWFMNLQLLSIGPQHPGNTDRRASAVEDEETNRIPQTCVNEATTPGLFLTREKGDNMVQKLFSTHFSTQIASLPTVPAEGESSHVLPHLCFRRQKQAQTEGFSDTHTHGTAGDTPNTHPQTLLHFHHQR